MLLVWATCRKILFLRGTESSWVVPMNHFIRVHLKLRVKVNEQGTSQEVTRLTGQQVPRAIKVRFTSYLTE